jgi:hypothetical protein
MNPVWFRVDPKAIDEACGPLDRFGLALILIGAAGVLFGVFWVVFGILCLVLDVGKPLYTVLIAVVGGLGPMAGAAVVAGLGVSRRLLASRLRELRTLAHKTGGVSSQQAALVMGSERTAQRLLRKGCELGVLSPAIRMP